MGLVEIAAAPHCADAQPQKCATAGTIAAAHVTSRHCSMCAQRTSAARLPPPCTQTLRQHAPLCTSLSSLPQAQSTSGKALPAILYYLVVKCYKSVIKYLGCYQKLFLILKECKCRWMVLRICWICRQDGHHLRNCGIKDGD